MRSVLAVLIFAFLFVLSAWVATRHSFTAITHQKTSKMTEVEQIEKKLSEIVSFRTAIDKDFAQIVGVAAFTTKTRIYPLHRHAKGDIYESRGLDDFRNDAIDYDMAVTCQESGNERYRYNFEILGRSEQQTSPEFVESMKRALLRRAALNCAHALIYIQHYADLTVDAVEQP